MTEAIIASLHPAEKNEALKPPSEHQNLVRRTIAGARPVLPDHSSRRTKMLMAQKLWKDAGPIAGTLVTRYLSNFGVEEFPFNLRYHPSVLHEPTRRHFPAMLAPVHDVNGQFAGIHRTYLSPDGSGLARVEEGESQRMLGNCFGSYVQFRPTKSFRLVVTQSIEAALIVQQSCHDLPVWAAMTLGNMKAILPPSVREVIFCADSNIRTPCVANKIMMDAVREQMGRGLTVLVAQPLPGMKLNDMRLR